MIRIVTANQKSGIAGSRTVINLTAENPSADKKAKSIIPENIRNIR